MRAAGPAVHRRALARTWPRLTSLSKPREAPSAQQSTSKPRAAPGAQQSISKPREAPGAQRSISKPREAPGAQQSISHGSDPDVVLAVVALRVEHEHFDVVLARLGHGDGQVERL